MEKITLKDIEETWNEFEDNLVSKEKLKEEAIKWVKSPEKSYYTTINWIMHFFNITEEDLQ